MASLWLFVDLQTSNELNACQMSRAPKLLDRIKCRSKVKTVEESGNGACSLTRNTLGVEGHVGTPGWDKED